MHCNKGVGHGSATRSFLVPCGTNFEDTVGFFRRRTSLLLRSSEPFACNRVSSVGPRDHPLYIVPSAYGCGGVSLDLASCSNDSLWIVNGPRRNSVYRVRV